MSIIQDALEKAQYESIKKPVPTRKKSLKPAVLITAIIALAVITYFGLKTRPQVSADNAPRARQASQGFSMPKIVMRPEENFVLSGVMFLEGKPRAIINGNVVEEGDTLDGATVEIIEEDCVLLNIKDTKTKLKLTQ